MSAVRSSESGGKRFSSSPSRGPCVPSIMMRVAIIQGRYNFKAQGLGRAIQRQQNINRYIQFVQTVVAGAPQFIPLINMPAFFERIFEGYHFPNPHELVPANVQEVYAQMQQALVNQQDPVVAEQARAAGGAAVAGAQ